MHALDILGDPVRRRILELLADGELAAGDVGAVVQAEFGISQPAVSQHLKVLRDNGFARVRAEGNRRLYAVEPEPLREADVWLEHFRRFWTPHLDALATELARGRRERRLRAERERAGRGRYRGRRDRGTTVYGGTMMEPFTVRVGDDVLVDLRERLTRTRWPDEADGAGWALGTDLAYLRDLVAYWRDGYDWRRAEAHLNTFAQYRTDIDGVTIHLVHERSVSGARPLPLILTHGWPSTFAELLPIVRALTDPAAHGGDPSDAFDVVDPVRARVRVLHPVHPQWPAAGPRPVGGADGAAGLRPVRRRPAATSARGSPAGSAGTTRTGWSASICPVWTSRCPIRCRTT